MLSPDDYFLAHKDYFVDKAFNKQGKPIDKTKLEWMFIDSKGRRYYKFIDDMDIPIVRKGQLQKLVMELSNCISGNELIRFLDAMDNMLNPPEADVQIKINIGRLNVLVSEMKMRKEVLIHPDIMMEIVAAHYIREDENPGDWDEELHREKVKQFEIDSKGGLYDFFYKASLPELIPFLKYTEVDWNIYMAKAKKSIQVMNHFLSGKKLTKQKKTESSL